MREGRYHRRGIRGIAAFGILGIGLVAIAVEAGAETRRDWLSTALYPARISALNWSQGSIDADHQMTWGSWSVSLPQTPPVATWGNAGAGAPSIGIEGLVCSNAVVGIKPCAMSFVDDTMNPAMNGQLCFLGIATQPATPPIQIRCPVSIDFVR